MKEQLQVLIVAIGFLCGLVIYQVAFENKQQELKGYMLGCKPAKESEIIYCFFYDRAEDFNNE